MFDEPGPRTGITEVQEPATGTPEVGGFTTHEALTLVRGMTGIDFVGGDLVEVLNGIAPGDEVVADGSFLLKGQLLRSTLAEEE